MNATPENFTVNPGFETVSVDFYSFRPEPGISRVLARARFGDGQYVELTCLEWSPSKIRVKVDLSLEGHTQRGIWIDNGNSFEIVERLPDVESGNHKAESPCQFEADSLIRFARLLIVNWPCRCDHCKVQKAKAYTRTEEAEKETLESAQTNA